MSALLEVRGLEKRYPLRSGLRLVPGGEVRAVDGVDLELAPGRTLGLVGESGSGKSTVARLVCRLLDPTAGEVVFEGQRIDRLRGRALRQVRQRLQLVLQDPAASFDPQATVADSLSEPLRVHLRLDRRACHERVAEALALVNLSAALGARRPHQLSGGQLQRAALARALATGPRLVVLDEAVSSLDVSSQAQVLNLLASLRRRLGVAYLFIAHDLSLVRHVSDDVAVMYLGRIVERGPAAAVYEAPKHPYTQALLSAVPVPHPARQRARRRIVLEGETPSPVDPPAGCHFHPRCPYAMDVCRTETPPLVSCADGAIVACHLHTSGPVLAGRSVDALQPGRSAGQPLLP